MEIIFRLVELLIKALLDSNKPDAAPVPRTQPTTQYIPGAATPRPRPVTSRSPVIVQPEPDEGDRWRLLINVLAVLVLLLMAAIWLLFRLGWISAV